MFAREWVLTLIVHRRAPGGGGGGPATGPEALPDQPAVPGDGSPSSFGAAAGSLSPAPQDRESLRARAARAGSFRHAERPSPAARSPRTSASISSRRRCLRSWAPSASSAPFPTGARGCSRARSRRASSSRSRRRSSSSIARPRALAHAQHRTSVPELRGAGVRDPRHAARRRRRPRRRRARRLPRPDRLRGRGLPLSGRGGGRAPRHLPHGSPGRDGGPGGPLGRRARPPSWICCPAFTT